MAEFEHRPRTPAPRPSRRWLLAGLVSVGATGAVLALGEASRFRLPHGEAAFRLSAASGRRPRVGFLSLYGQEYPDPANAWVESFRRGMEAFGYEDGRNVEIAYRFADDDPDRLQEQTNELLSLPVDVLVRADTRFLNELKEKTQTVPVVMSIILDPVGSGLAASIREPGGNFTGVRLEEPSIHGKRLELLKEVVPHLKRVGILVSERNFISERVLRDVTPLANQLGLEVELVVVSRPSDLAAALDQAASRGMDGLYRTTDPRLSGYIRPIAEAAVQYGLPSIGLYREEVEAGLLLSYAANRGTMFYDSARLVDRILRGGSPATTPIELASRFDLFVNRATARTLGLTIPQDILKDAAGTVD